MKNGTFRLAEELSRINPDSGGPMNPATPLANVSIPKIDIYN